MTIKVSKPAKGLREAIAEVIGRGASVINGMTKGDAQDELEVSRKNWIINGDHQVDQRGNLPITGMTNGAYELTDRWVSKNASVTADASVSDGWLRVASTSTDGKLGSFQRVEDFGSLAGETITVSAKVKSNNGAARIELHDGGSYFTNKAIDAADGSEQTISITTTVSSSASAFSVHIGVVEPVNTTTTISSGDYIEFTNVKLEIGDTATPFESRSYAEELALCQRYYQRITQDGSANLLPLGACFANSSTNIRTALHLPVEMRAAPTIAVSAAADFTSYIDATAYAATAVGTVASSPTSPVIYMTVTGATDGQTGYGQIEASSSGWIDFLAEL